MEAIGLNISDLGMCLFTVANLPLGCPIQVEFLASECTAPIRVHATVRHRGLYLYGIVFSADCDLIPAEKLAGPETTESMLSRP